MPSDSALLRDLVLITRDGEWGRETPEDGYAGARVIRGADFPSARIGDLSGVPTRYIHEQARALKALRPGDIVIETAGGGRDRPTGRTLLVTRQLVDASDLPTTCASFSRFLRVDPAKAEPRYVFWYLQYLYEIGVMWEHQVQHTGLARFQYTRFAETVAVPLPPNDEQRRIADILCAVDDKIELNHRMNQTLEAMARAVFRSWFVDFDPVVAKAEGRQPFGMDAETAALFPNRFVESELGPIPDGWRVSRIGEEVRVVGGSTPGTTRAEYWEGGTIRWVTPRDLARLSDPVVLTTERCITAAGLEQISSGLLPVGTVLLSSRAPIGYLAVAEVPLAVNQGFIAMICERRLPSLYVLRWAAETMEDILSRAGGTTFAEISKANFRPIPVLLPDSQVLKAYDAVVGPWFKLVVENVRQSRTVAELRDTLLPKLLSGEIRVRDAEKKVEAAL